MCVSVGKVPVALGCHVQSSQSTNVTTCTRTRWGFYKPQMTSWLSHAQWKFVWWMASFCTDLHKCLPLIDVCFV